MPGGDDMSAPKLDLAAHLAEGIASGRYPVGSLLPTEFELCEQHGASRYKVRLALQALHDQGLISRRKNVGTRVEAARPAGPFTQSIATVDELGQFGAEHVRRLKRIEEVAIDRPLADAMGCAAGTRWLRISSLRMSDARKDQPLGWTDVYVEPAYAAIGSLVAEHPDMLISALIEQQFGRRIARVQQQVQAIGLPGPLAEELKAEPGSPALQIVRRYLDAGDEAFEISVSVHPADRFTFSMELSRGRA